MQPNRRATFPDDPEAPRVAARVIDAILDCRSTLYVDHIGSTAVPGCGGKGIIDLLVSYPAGAFFVARDALDQLGFQAQGGPEPFPESRPMRVGAATYRGKTYRVHAHVIRSGDREATGSHQVSRSLACRCRASASLPSGEIIDPLQRYHSLARSIRRQRVNLSVLCSARCMEPSLLHHRVLNRLAVRRHCRYLPLGNLAIEKHACSCL